MRRLLPLLTLLLTSWAAPTQAEPLLTLIPSGGVVEAEAGDTVGWGYEIVNDDLDRWLVISSIFTDVFQHGFGSDLIFDFPIVAPSATVTTPHAAGLQGLYEFTWDAGAPAGFVNSGVFTVGAEWWDGDPFAGGQFLEAAPDFVVSYEASVRQPDARVPEPSTWLLIVSGLALAAVSRRRAPRSVPVRARV